MVNAIEIDYTIPYAIPDDRTEATIVCKDDDTAKNHMTVYGSSVSSNKWGKSGSCWYFGYQASPFTHTLLCNGLGKVDKDSHGKIAFQFAIDNIDKALSFGASAKTGYVVPKVL